MRYVEDHRRQTHRSDRLKMPPTVCAKSGAEGLSVVELDEARGSDATAASITISRSTCRAC